MRQNIELQMELDEVDFSNVCIDVSCRDDIPKILLGLQHIYSTQELRRQVLEIIRAELAGKVDLNNGRTGMLLWRIFTLGVLRLNLNCDHDRIHDLANNHAKIRQALGHVILNDGDYKLQTIKDNLAILSPTVYDKINRIVVGAGYELLHVATNQLRIKCDSFVVETYVHYPTDINLLLDSIRKVITIISDICDRYGCWGWRQKNHNLKKAKRLYRRAQKLKHSTSKNDEKKEKRQWLIIEAHETYIEIVEAFLGKVDETKDRLSRVHGALALDFVELDRFIIHAKRQIDQVRRRVIQGETIPHCEKVFSIFEEHTEWISKGKAGVPVELGLRVAVVEDQHGFILHHSVLEKETDDKVAVRIIKETEECYGHISAASFDKGFYTPSNKKELNEIVDLLVLPKKGKLSVNEKEIESTEEWREARRQHSGVESAINALEVHGLDRCRDHGIDGFKRYVSLAILARNLQQIGEIIRKRELEKLKRQRRKKAA